MVAGQEIVPINQYGSDVRADPSGGAFRSSHYPDYSTILVHTRANERTLPSGEPGRFVEEVQSDWHQQGKKVGYSRPLTPDEQAE